MPSSEKKLSDELRSAWTYDNYRAKFTPLDCERWAARAAALEAKLERVRAEAEAGIDFEDAWGLQERLLTILDGEGSDSHE